MEKLISDLRYFSEKKKKEKEKWKISIYPLLRILGYSKKFVNERRGICKNGKGGTRSVTRHGRNRLKLLPIFPRWRAIERRVILEFNKELDRGSLIKGRAASVELTARNRAKRRQDVDDSPISTGYPGILSHSIIRHADSSALSNLLSIFGERQFPGGGCATLISTLFQPGDSISISSRPEVLREWLLSHFRTKKKSNERTMEPAGYWKGRLGWCAKKDMLEGRDKGPLRHSPTTLLPIILENVSTFPSSPPPYLFTFPLIIPSLFHVRARRCASFAIFPKARKILSPPYR